MFLFKHEMALVFGLAVLILLFVLTNSSTRTGFIVVVVILMATIIAIAVYSQAEEELIRQIYIRIAFVLFVSSLPGFLYLVFVRTRQSGMLSEYVGNLNRFGLVARRTGEDHRCGRSASAWLYRTFRGHLRKILPQFP